jgi:DNA-binding NtrC family response regulator
MSDQILAICDSDEDYQRIHDLLTKNSEKLGRQRDLASAIQSRPSQAQKRLLVVEEDKLQEYARLLQTQTGPHPPLSSLEPVRRTGDDIPELIGRSETFRDICRQIGEFARSDDMVYIHGEAGTGKHVVARAIHQSSSRANHPLIQFNCSEIPERLFEYELFGYQKGAFTGAQQDHSGSLSQAGEGTLVLEDVGTLSRHSQQVLLNSLRKHSYRPVGDSTEHPLTARIIIISHVHLSKLVKKGHFLKELYTLLEPARIYMPPLREREEDILPLAQHFLEKYSHQLHKSISDFDASVHNMLMDHDWPGNIRELDNVIEYATLIEPTNQIKATSLPGLFLDKESLDHSSLRPELTLKSKLALFEHKVILDALEKSHWVKKDAARLLGIDPRNMSYYITKNNIKEPKSKRTKSYPVVEDYSDSESF